LIALINSNKAEQRGWFPTAGFHACLRPAGMIHALKIQQYQTITSAFQKELAQVAGRTNVRGHVTAPGHGSNSALENTSRENLN